jgi:hypothetical protein
MKTIAALIVLSLSGYIYGQSPKPATLRSILLEQLHTTHNEKDWFVPIDVAVEGLTADQANWKDGSGNHSVGQMTYHLLFWNERELAKFKGEPGQKFSGNNDETFNNPRQQKVERYGQTARPSDDRNGKACRNRRRPEAAGLGFGQRTDANLGTTLQI